jgi:hypothetical protein
MDPQPWTFPVLGLPHWPGPRRRALRSGAVSLSVEDFVGPPREPVNHSLSHSYYRPGEDRPCLVISQHSPTSERHWTGASLDLLLRRRPANPFWEGPLTLPVRHERVERTLTLIEPEASPDGRVLRSRLRWRERPIDIATLDLPQDSAFFAALADITPPPPPNPPPNPPQNRPPSEPPKPPPTEPPYPFPAR